jgi:hypothetical protein
VERVHEAGYGRGKVSSKVSPIADNVQESNGQVGSSGRDGQIEGVEELGMRFECDSIFTAPSWQYSLQWFMQWSNPKALMLSCLPASYCLYQEYMLWPYLLLRVPAGCSK